MSRKTVILPLAVLVAFLSADKTFGQETLRPKVVEKPVHVALDSAPWRPCEGLPGCEYIPLRGNPETEPSEALFRLPASIRFPEHWHTSPEHIIGVKGTLIVNLENGQQVPVGPGTFLYNPGAMIHWGSCSDEESCVYYVYDDRPYDIHLVEEGATGTAQKE